MVWSQLLPCLSGAVGESRQPCWPSSSHCEGERLPPDHAPLAPRDKAFPRAVGGKGAPRLLTGQLPLSPL